MNKARSIGATCVAAAIMALLLVQQADAAAVVYSDSGAQVADLSGPADPLAQFRAALGADRGVGPNPGGLPGRREINWDAAGLDGVADPNLMPANQFNQAAAPFARGAAFSTPGNGFFVSRRCEQDGAAPPCGGSNILLGLGPDAGLNVNFRAFSEQRIFSPVGSNIMDVTFAKPGVPGQRATTTTPTWPRSTASPPSGSTSRSSATPIGSRGISCSGSTPPKSPRWSQLRPPRKAALLQGAALRLHRARRDPGCQTLASPQAVEMGPAKGKT